MLAFGIRRSAVKLHRLARVGIEALSFEWRNRALAALYTSLEVQPLRRALWVYDACSSGHTSTTPCATAQGVRDTMSTASARLAASITIKPATGSAELMNGPFVVADLHGVGIAHLDRCPRDGHQRAIRPQLLIVGMGGVSDGRGRAVVTVAVPISDRHEFRHRSLPSDRSLRSDV